MERIWQLLAYLEETASEYKGLLALAGTTATVLGLFIAPVQRRLRKYLQPTLPGPVLSDPAQGDHGPARYSMRAVELLGRDAELSRLKEFLRCDRSFAWMQIAGAGGQGKSRLTYELTLLARGKGWQAGLVETADLAAFRAKWLAWQPKCPHLLVLDYVIGREADIKAAIQTLAARSSELRKPVRILLLERQRWDHGGLGLPGSMSDGGAKHGFEGRAEWFLAIAERPDGNDPRLELTRFEDGIIELDRLSESDLIDITLRVAKLQGIEVNAAPSVIGERLGKIDSAGRPLYAYFLGQVLGAGGSVGPSWTRYDLLDATLDRDQGARWRAALGDTAPSLGDGSLAERLAVIATIAGGLDCTAAQRDGVILHADEQTRRQARVLTDAGTSSKGNNPSIIPSLQPDLLGEWLVLRAIQRGLPVEDVLGPAWRVNPEQTAAFLNRLAQDFPDYPSTADFLDFEPTSPAAAVALAGVTASIVWSLYRAARPIPECIVKALTDAAEGGDPRAMTRLGSLCWYGHSIALDRDRAVVWWRNAAKAGESGAMANLGYCYAHGEGVERDMSQALDWYRMGAEAGNGLAMANLGYCYAHGEGVERDKKRAVYWYERGAEAGNGFAIVNLGRCYEKGEGVAPDMAQALYWYRKGTEAGDGIAMVNLGICYENGEGVERDMAQALDWYRKGAKAGDGRAMAYLGVSYEKGAGVARDMAQAVDWYRKGAEAGDGKAMAYLGYCYEKGEGAARDMTQALDWYRKGAEAGDGVAMAGVGSCYEHGHGVERDLEQALMWYRKGADLASAQALDCYRKGVEEGSDVALRAARRLSATREVLGGGDEISSHGEG